jgi:tetratricopeptide (TPR) repeat protein
MRRSEIVFALLTLGVAARVCGRGVSSLPPDMHQWALSSIDLVYREEFDQASEHARRIVQKYPEHPAGYFFTAAALDAWMHSFQSSAKETEFYQYCNQAVEKAELLLEKKGEDPWVRFFMGGAEGLKGNYEMRYERWITAFRYGWKGVTVLRKLQERYRDFSDLEYGIGSYLYWRSAMARVLKWLPSINDERAEGIAMLRRARQSGTYTSTVASAALVEVFANEQQHDSTLALAEGMLARYPGNLTFQVARARALYGLGRYEDAERVWRVILAKVEREQSGSRYQAALARYYLARLYYQVGRYASCIAECEGMRRHASAEEVHGRLADLVSEIRDLQQAAGREHAEGKSRSGG